jgi:hypothetical protein
MDIKRCSKCKEEKLINNFWKDSRQKDGYIHQCIPCKKQTQSKVYSDPDRKKHHMITVRKWNDNNNDKNRTYQKIFNHKKRSTELGVLKANLSSYLSICLKNNNLLGMKERTLKVIGMESWDEFKQYIESLWVENMNWDNYGIGKNNTTWHIDHITPVSKALTIEQTYILFHYTNLRPMWGSDNIRKRNN